MKAFGLRSRALTWAGFFDKPLDTRARLMLDLVCRTVNSSHRIIAISSMYSVSFSSRWSRKASSMTEVMLRGCPPFIGGFFNAAKHSYIRGDSQDSTLV